MGRWLLSKATPNNTDIWHYLETFIITLSEQVRIVTGKQELKYRTLLNILLCIAHFPTMTSYLAKNWLKLRNPQLDGLHWSLGSIIPKCQMGHKIFSLCLTLSSYMSSVLNAKLTIRDLWRRILSQHFTIVVKWRKQSKCSMMQISITKYGYFIHVSGIICSIKAYILHDFRSHIESKKH